MAVFDNLNYSYSQGVAPGIIAYHERNLLRDMKPEFVYGRDAQVRTLPEGNGKYVNFRRMVPYGAVTEPLKEGVTPDGQELKQTSFSVMVKPYGRHIETTDELNFYHIDDLHREANKLLSDQAILSLDTICRNAVTAGLNVQYAGGKTNRGQLTAADKLTGAEIKKAVRTLQRANAKTFPDGYYHAIVHPETVYDLTDDPMWIDIAKYQDKSKIEKYELGTMYGVKFFKSTNARTFEGDQYIFGNTASLTITNMDVATRTATISNELTEVDARNLTGRLVDVSDGSAVTPMCIERVDAKNKTVLFRWATEAVEDATTILPTGGGASGATVHGTVIYADNAFGRVDLGGTGHNVQVIIKPLGSSGAADPLNQRATIAWKVKGFCCAILQDSFIVRIEHGATA